MLLYDDLFTTEAVASSSVKCTRGRPCCTRGSLPRVQHLGKTIRGISSRERRLPREPKIVHSGKAFLRAMLALGEELTPLVASRRHFLLFFKKNSSPSATLGEETLFPKRRSSDTRGSNPLPRAS